MEKAATMGLFYTTFTTRGPDNSAVVAALKKLRRTAFVSPTLDGYTVIYERKTEEQNFTEIDRLGAGLSKAYGGAPSLAAALHDDDVLYLWLFRDGKCTDFYDSLPQYFDPVAQPGPPEGGDSKMLCDSFADARKAKRIEKLLRANLLEDELPKIPGELERHQAIIKEFGMPAFAAEVTYSSIEGRYMPAKFRKVKFTPVGKR
jgi:hypothetical protein